jgi:hypothetical protein
MPICSKMGCDKEATEVIKLHVFTATSGTPAEIFASIYACSEEHKAPDNDICYFFEQNWELLCVGFQQRGFRPPVLKKTQFAWLPIEEFEEFKKLHAKTDEGPKGFVHIN